MEHKPTFVSSRRSCAGVAVLTLSICACGTLDSPFYVGEPLLVFQLEERDFGLMRSFSDPSAFIAWDDGGLTELHGVALGSPLLATLVELQSAPRQGRINIVEFGVRNQLFFEQQQLPDEPQRRLVPRGAVVLETNTTGYVEVDDPDAAVRACADDADRALATCADDCAEAARAREACGPAVQPLSITLAPVPPEDAPITMLLWESRWQTLADLSAPPLPSPGPP